MYVELRAREDRSDPLRQCCLTFMHLNVYSMKAINDQPMQLCMDSIQLDTLKGYVGVYFRKINRNLLNFSN